MIIRSLKTKGILDLSSQNIHPDKNLPIEEFKHLPLSLGPGQSIEIDDRYRRLKNIDLAISAGLIEVVSYDSSPTSTVIQEEVGTGGSGGTIGDPGTCDYDEGLLDLDEDTTIGQAVCEINRVLASIAPAEAPALTNLTSTTSGSNGSLSFGASNFLIGYASVAGIGDLPARDVDGTFYESAFGDDFRNGMLFTGDSISAELNGNVVANGSNYSAGSFGKASDGNLKLRLNGLLLLTIDLSSSVSAIVDSTLNGSSLSVSTATSGTSYTGEPFDLYVHRTGDYTIDTSDMINGWNYIQVTHEVIPAEPTSFITTNYIDWIKDSDTTPLSASSPVLDNLSMTGLNQISGISYFTGGTAEYDLNIEEAYKNIYDSSTGAITFNGTNSTASAIDFDPILAGDETKTMTVADHTVTITATKLIDESISISTNASHPRTSDSLVTGGLASISNILLDNTAPTSTNSDELFDDEVYRLESDNYSTQADVTNIANAFDSASDRASGGDAIIFNSQLVGVPSLTNGGDFTSITNAPTPNVDYSVIPAGELSYYRKVENVSGGSLTGFTLTVNGSGTIVTSAPTANDEIFIEAKNPGKTGWMNFNPFNFSFNDGDGMLSGSFEATLNASNEGTFGVNFYDVGESVVFRFTYLKDFTGNIDSISINLI
jgi:hypothetical protein